MINIQQQRYIRYIAIVIYWYFDAKDTGQCTKTTYGFFDRQKSVTHPSSCSSISTDICESFLVVSVGGTERHFFYCLINNQPLMTHNMHTC